MLIIVLAIFNSLSTPVEITFKPDYINNSGFKIFNGVIDLIFFMDMCINFRTSFIAAESGDEII